MFARPGDMERKLHGAVSRPGQVGKGRGQPATVALLHRCGVGDPGPRWTGYPCLRVWRTQPGASGIGTSRLSCAASPSEEAGSPDLPDGDIMQRSRINVLSAAGAAARGTSVSG